jgi:hypothetical protein
VDAASWQLERARADQHPVVMLTGCDIVELLQAKGY